MTLEKLESYRRSAEEASIIANAIARNGNKFVKSPELELVEWAIALWADRDRWQTEAEAMRIERDEHRAAGIEAIVKLRRAVGLLREWLGDGPRCRKCVRELLPDPDATTAEREIDIGIGEGESTDFVYSVILRETITFLREQGD